MMLHIRAALLSYLYLFDCIERGTGRSVGSWNGSLHWIDATSWIFDYECPYGVSQGTRIYVPCKRRNVSHTSCDCQIHTPARAENWCYMVRCVAGCVPEQRLPLVKSDCRTSLSGWRVCFQRVDSGLKLLFFFSSAVATLVTSNQPNVNLAVHECFTVDGVRKNQALGHFSVCLFRKCEGPKSSWASQIATVAWFTSGNNDTYYKSLGLAISESNRAV